MGAKDGNKYYRMEDKFNVDNVRKFAQAVVDGALEPKIKEEPSYDDDHDASGEADDSDYEESDVTVLHGRQLRRRDRRQGRDARVLRALVRPLPGAQAVTYKELGTRLAGADVVVGAMDATANSPPDGHDVRGYPTLIFKTGLGQDDVYDGDRDVDSTGGVHQGARGGRVREVGLEAPDVGPDCTPAAPKSGHMNRAT